MIRFEPVREPEGFAEQVTVPGNRWRIQHPDAKRPRDFWSPFKGHLAHGFGFLCAYSALFEPVGTVDHFISWAEDPTRAYDWSNYRYAAAWINSCKGSLESHELLDPFEVEDDWFELLLPSLQLVLTQAIPRSHRRRAEQALRRLHLQDDERILRQRREWYRMYQEGEIDLKGLRKKAPLIARAITKQSEKK